MKKYNSFKTIKPSNPILSPKSSHLQYPTHSVSYRKLTTIDLTNQRPFESISYTNFRIINLPLINQIHQPHINESFKEKDVFF